MGILNAIRDFEKNNEYLTKCIVDTKNMTFTLIGSIGTERIILSDNSDQFYNMLNVAKKMIGDTDLLEYKTAA